MGGHEASIRELARRQGTIRARDLTPLGIPRTYLTRLCQRGVLTRVARGLYELTDTEVTEHHSLVEASKRVPHGVVCLLSALQYHGLGTQLPFETWLAIDSRARRPKVDYPPLRVVRMGGRSLTEAVEDHSIEGVPVQVYSAAKTVADCFKFRNKIGIDVALEALRDYLSTYRGQGDELWRLAGVCRVQSVMLPYLEALA